MDRIANTRSLELARAHERRQIDLESAAFRIMLHWMTGETYEQPPRFRPRSLHRKTARKRVAA
jgi:hypothetical protein